MVLEKALAITATNTAVPKFNSAASAPPNPAHKQARVLSPSPSCAGLLPLEDEVESYLSKQVALACNHVMS